MAKRKKEPEIRLPKIEQLPSGAWHTRVLLDGRRVSITKDSYDQCVAEYFALKNKIAEAKPAPGKPITLNDAVTRYIDQRRGFRSPSTIQGYIKFQRNLFRPLMERNIFTITDKQWQEQIRELGRQGKSPKYIKNGWAFFASCLVEAGAKRPEVMLFPPEEKERPFLQPEEIDIFVEAIRGHRFEIPYLLCLSSLRRSEMIALDWDCVDLTNGVLYVRGAIVAGPEGMVEKPQNKTSKSRRAVPIIPPLAEAISAQQKREGKVVTAGVEAIYRSLSAVCISAGITVVDLHGLRHSFASLAYYLQIPEMIAAEIGGWNDTSTMHKIYTHLAQKDIAKRSRDFCNYFSKEEMEKRKIGNAIGNEKQKH